MHYYNGDSVVSCAVPVGNLSWMLFQEGRNELDRLHALTIITTSSVLVFVVLEQ